MDQYTGKGNRTFLAEEVMVPGKIIIPFAMFFSSRMLSSLRGSRKLLTARQSGEYTNFRMVFTPTLFSSEKNINIWLEGSVWEFVKKLSWLRLQSCTVSDTI
jgi:hypothetical protein